MAAKLSGSGGSSENAARGNDGVEAVRRGRILSSKLYFDVPASKVKNILWKFLIPLEWMSMKF